MDTNKNNINKTIVIAGPCAAESAEQIEASIREAKKRRVDFLRVNLWKPRTKPGFDGLGKKGLPLLIQVAKSGISPALEVILPEHAKAAMDAVLPVLGSSGKLLLWIGSRNQNHIVQRKIAKIASKDTRVLLLVKNQPWVNEEHWEGIIGHALSGGMKKENLLNCHRGFSPNGYNPLGLRNVPDFEMSMKLKAKTNLPILFDPSHTGGSVANVFEMAKQAANHNFDGILVEVHPNPQVALTDAKQQLTWEQFDEMMKIFQKQPTIKNITIKGSNIFIGSDLLKDISSLVDFTKYTKVVIVTDNNVPKSLVSKLKSAIPTENLVISINSGEQNKNLATVQKIWEALADFGCDRKSLVINIGGGVIGDIGGFVAATFMRGIDFIQIPTTLLAQVDASIGGKVGINSQGIKNLIGSFQQPVAVIIDTDTLKTLPKREFISGFAEIIKHGLIADEKYFQLVTSKRPLEFSQEELVEIIERSCRIKADIVTKDEKEGGSRKLLNFGHTIGHAVEAISQEGEKPLLHGEAISIGMIAEGKISRLLGLLSEEEYKTLEQALIRAGLPISQNLLADEILKKIKSDKKNIKGETKFTLLEDIGKGIIDQTVDESIIRKVI